MSDFAVNADHLLDLAGTIFSKNASENDRIELNAILLADEVSRRCYLDYCLMHVALRVESRARRAVQLAHQQINIGTVGSAASSWDAVRTEPSPAPAFLPVPSYGTTNYFADGWPVAYLLAAVILGVGIAAAAVTYISQPVYVASAVVQKGGAVAEPSAPCVGKITGTVDCNWPGDSRVSLGQKYELASGLLEITYDTGAKVILQGPVTYSVEANGGYLAVGKLTGKLEKSGERTGERGEVAANHQIPNLKSQIVSPSPLSPLLSPLFVIRTPTAMVTDLGTEFGVEVNEEGATESQVFAGSVKITVLGEQNKGVKEQIIHAGSAMRVDTKGNQLPAIQPDWRRFVRTLPPRTQVSKADAYAELVLSMKPFAYYRMERPANRKDDMVVFDSAPGGHHGTTCLVHDDGGGAWVAGRFGTALYLGSPDPGDYADVKNFPTTNTNQLSVSAWVYAPAPGLVGQDCRGGSFSTGP